ncbi:ABC transporter permease subunit [Micromonospora sp. HNM0581]|uniref:ABC transporter permease subunit n=1 Tax=Micromonospora sp. HNM0581 TaxID=2716341 RepID=UPI00146B87AE|nr:ABC transporter permease subunit [Micromonospora sp. HNM0581]NLU79137.1 ABC transporter permease subunit [Micromonospora sp. HNM0581]
MTPRRLAVLMMSSFVLVIAVCGPWLSAVDPNTPVAGPFEPSSGAHPLGTDVLGRDTLARVLDGGRALIMQAAVATMLGSVIGLTVGLGAALTRRRTVARFAVLGVDAIAVFPAILLLLVLAAGLPGGGAAVVAASVVVSVPFSVRVIRECTTAIIATEHARSAWARGDALMVRLRHDVLPALAPAALAEAGIRFVAAVQLAATAGFLGLGASAPAANWGRMVQENSAGITVNPLPVLVPATLLVLLAVGVTFLLDHITGPLLGERDRVGPDLVGVTR